jgi:hypothetical protein
MDDLDVRVSDKAISVNGAQVSWTLQIHKDDYLYECLEKTVLEVDVNDDWYAHDNAEDCSDDMQFLDNDDDIAWK